MSQTTNTPSTHCALRRGFTLIEMIIAIMVMSIGIMGLAGHGELRGDADGWRQHADDRRHARDKVADSLAARRCSALVSGTQTQRGVTITWTVADSSRTKWVTEQVQYKTKRGSTKTVNYVTVIQCPD